MKLALQNAVKKLNPKNMSLGSLLLNLYRVFLFLAFLFSGFDFWRAIVLGSYPLMLLFRLNPAFTFYIDANFGYYGFSILCILIQGGILQSGGNALEKLFRKAQSN
jgi:hypothetical protein